jgi:hypothetical protein
MRSEDEIAVLEFIRGERPWTALQDVGITIELEGDHATVNNPYSVVVAAGAADIAQGLLRFAGEPEQMKIWAWIVLAGTSFIEFDLDSHPRGGELLGALWDVGFGDPLRPDLVRLAKDVVGGN